MINGKRCVIFTANLLPKSSHPWPTALFKAPKGDWADFLLYILNDDVYVFPKGKFTQNSAMALSAGYIYDYKNSWCVLEGVDPTSSKQMDEYRKRLEKESKEAR